MAITSARNRRKYHVSENLARATRSSLFLSFNPIIRGKGLFLYILLLDIKITQFVCTKVVYVPMKRTSLVLHFAIARFSSFSKKTA